MSGKRPIGKGALTKALKALTPPQVIDLVCRLAERRPDIKEDLEELLPHADVAAQIKALTLAKNKVFRAFPNTRWGPPQLDNYCFNRVRTQLSAFLTMFTKQSTAIAASGKWDDFLLYASEAHPIISRVPIWKSEDNNIRYPLVFQRVLDRFTAALDKGSDLTALQRTEALRLRELYAASTKQMIGHCGHHYRGDMPDDNTELAPAVEDDGHPGDDPAGGAAAEEEAGEEVPMGAD